MSSIKYFDKRGNEIKAGTKIKHNDGSIELVYECGDNDLGVNASNMEYLKNHPDAEQEFYPLYQFNTKYEWEIVE